MKHHQSNVLIELNGLKINFEKHYSMLHLALLKQYCQIELSKLPFSEGYGSGPCQPGCTLPVAGFTMMTSRHGNTVLITGPLWRESIGQDMATLSVLLTLCEGKPLVTSGCKGLAKQSFDFSLLLATISFQGSSYLVETLLRARFGGMVNQELNLSLDMS